MSSRSSHRAQPSLASGEKESVYPAGVEHKVTESGGGQFRGFEFCYSTPKGGFEDE